jgi:bifunctional DNase/RNase
LDKIQVEISALSATPTSGGAYALLLKEVNGTRVLPIIIGAFEAQAIALELEGIKPPRPLTHDLAKTIIETLGGQLIEVVIDDLRDNTFFAKMIFELSSLSQEIDARPSDAIAMSVRFRCPMYANARVLDEAGFIPNANEAETQLGFPTEKKQPPKKLTRENKIFQLQTQLREAIEKEDYERAAKLRDELKRISGEN